MFSFDRETITIVMTVLALAAVFYIYQDSQKMKKEILRHLLMHREMPRSVGLERMANKRP